MYNNRMRLLGIKFWQFKGASVLGGGVVSKKGVTRFIIRTSEQRDPPIGFPVTRMYSFSNFFLRPKGLIRSLISSSVMSKKASPSTKLSESKGNGSV